jgi:hypothetical protein
MGMNWMGRLASLGLIAIGCLWLVTIAFNPGGKPQVTTHTQK